MAKRIFPDTESLERGDADWWACPDCGEPTQVVRRRDELPTRECTACDFSFTFPAVPALADDADVARIARNRSETSSARSSGLFGLSQAQTNVIMISIGTGALALTAGYILALASVVGQTALAVGNIMPLLNPGVLLIGGFGVMIFISGGMNLVLESVADVDDQGAE